MKRKYINDNIHGRIEVNEIELDITRTGIFQRLGRIKQLGLAYMVFPSATHTRFSHSLGTLHIMTNIIRHLKQNGADIHEHLERNLRLAALLHDIGQYPLSHVIEFVYKRISPEEFFEENDTMTLSQSECLMNATTQSPSNYEDASDKNIGAMIIEKDPEINAVFTKHCDYITDEDKEEIASIVRGTSLIPFVHQLTDSHYDCDRLDSLSRDSRLCGVSYGNIDLEYLIENLRCVHEPVYMRDSVNMYLAVNKKRALHTLEHYLVSRYFIYSQLIHHRHIKSFELLAKAIFFFFAYNVPDFVFRSYGEIEESIGTQEFLGFDDNYFFRKIFEYLERPNGNCKVKGWIKRLISRKSIPVIYDVRELKDKDNETDTIYETMFYNPTNLETLCNAANVSSEEIIPNRVEVDFVPVQTAAPQQIMDGITDNGLKKIRADLRESPRLFDEDNNQESKMLLFDNASFVHYMSKRKLIILTVYSLSEDERAHDKIKAEFRKRKQSTR